MMHGPVNISFPETFLILDRSEGDMIKNVRYICLHVKYSLCLENLKFLERFSKNIEI